MRKFGSLLRQRIGHTEETAGFVRELFTTLLTTSMLLLLLETIWKESVTPYLDPTHFFIMTAAVGLIAILIRPEGEEKNMAGYLGNKNTTIAVLSGLAVLATVYLKTREIGGLSCIISIASGALTMLLLLFVWRGENEREDSQSR